MPPGNGISIGVSANTSAVTRQMANLGTGLGKLAGTSKNLFGANNAQQVNNYVRHLAQLERNLDRVNTRVKTLIGTQQQLLQQQRQLQQTGGIHQQEVNARALLQNQRSLSFWQAKQVGGQAALNVAQQNAPLGARVGGGGGGVAGFFAGQMQQAAGGIGGIVLKALGVAALAKGASAIAAKVFSTALDEQKLFADLAPRMLGNGTSMTSSQGWMNALRNRSMPLGFSGIEGLQTARAMAPGSSAQGLLNDTQTSMKMARMFGIDAGGQASMLAEGGKMGGFVPGQAKRFGEILGREIGKANPRAQEVQEATLMLMHRQLEATGTTNVAAAATQQLMLSRTGIPGLQGQFGANVLAGANATMQNSSDDPSIAFQEATLRDQRGVKGYYALRRFKEQISSDPTALRDTIREAYKLSANDDAAKDLISRQTGLPMTLLDKMGAATRGGLRNIGANNKLLMAHLTGGAGVIDQGASSAMQQTGNKFRVGEATISGIMARMGTPMVNGIGTLVDKASTEIQRLMTISDNTKDLPTYLRGQIQDRVDRLTGRKPGDNPGVMAGVPVGGGRHVSSNGLVGDPVPGDARHNRVLPGGGPPTAAQMHRNRNGVPILPSVGPMPVDGRHSSVMQRGDAGSHVHLHVSFDHTGAIHPHAKLAFMGMVKESLEEIQRQGVRGHVHRRYARV